MANSDLYNPSPVLSFDGTGSILDMNPAARALFRGAEVGQARLMDLIPEAEGLRVDALIRADGQVRLHTHQQQRLYEFTFVGVSAQSAGLAYGQDITEAHETQETLRLMLGVTSSIDRADLFRSILRMVVSALGVKAALVAEELEARPRRFRTVALWHDQGFAPDITVRAAQTPLEQIRGGNDRSLLVRDGLQTEYPRFKLARQFGAVSYLGIPLSGSNGQPIGVVAVLDDVPLRDVEEAEAMLRVFSGLLAGELERKRAEERLHELLQSYRQQTKELSCLWGLAESIRTRATLAEICQDVVGLLPYAWSHPALAGARILLDDAAYLSAEFVESQCGLSASIVVGGVSRGMVQVFYRELPGPGGDEGVFLPSERKLIDSVAHTLGEALERRAAEAENEEKNLSLARARNRLETILRCCGEGIVVTDMAGNVQIMNPAAAELLGLGEEGWVDRSFLGLLQDEAFRTAWRETAAAGEDLVKRDLTAPGNRALWVTRTRLAETESGESGYVTILNDVTKERAINQMKTDFVSAVSHELRTPMTSIKGFASTLLYRPDIDAETRTRFLSIIDTEADRLTTLIEELLLISRIEAERVLMVNDPMDIGRLVERVGALLAPAMGRKNITFERDVPLDLPQPIGDIEKFHAVVFNLLDNAIKFTPSGGAVSIRARVERNSLIIDVSDTGEGIPPEEQGRIFERFYRVRRPGQQTPGTGLGLFIAREMTTLHGGQIRVSSSDASGTTFSVSIPLQVQVSREPEGAPGGQREASHD